jgi:glutathione S-transferase
MIDLHYATTPNGLKLKLFLEEAAIPYRGVLLSLSRGDQFRPEFTLLSPNNRIPAIVDHDPRGGGAPLTMFESGAIMLYLAEKTGRLIPTDTRGRSDVLQWLFWQMSALGPMAGQAGYFRVYAPQTVPFAIERYTQELARLYGVLDRRLADREYIAAGSSRSARGRRRSAPTQGSRTSTRAAVRRSRPGLRRFRRRAPCAHARADARCRDVRPSLGKHRAGRASATRRRWRTTARPCAASRDS